MVTVLRFVTPAMADTATAGTASAVATRDTVALGAGAAKIADLGGYFAYPHTLIADLRDAQGDASRARDVSQQRVGRIAGLLRHLAAMRKELVAMRKELATMPKELAAVRRGLAVMRRGLAVMRRGLAAVRRGLAAVRKELAAVRRGLAARHRELATGRRRVRRLNVMHSAGHRRARATARRSRRLTAPAGRGIGAIALRYALTRLGDPYVWGADGPGAFDCSGLVKWAYARAGVYLPHYTVSQWNAGRQVSRNDLRPGDIVFFYSGLSHDGLYVGNGLMIDAPNASARVRIEPVWWNLYEGAVRIGS